MVTYGIGQQRHNYGNVQHTSAETLTSYVSRGNYGNVQRKSAET